MWRYEVTTEISANKTNKSSVRYMCKNAAMSYAEYCIRVNSLHPGIVDTPMIAAQDADITAGVVENTPMNRLGRPKQLAYGALFLVSDESSFMTASELVIDCGYTAP